MSQTQDIAFLDDLSLDEARKALKVKAKAKTSKTATKKVEDSTLDLAWTAFASIMLLIGRLLKTLWKFRAGILAGAFILQNGAYIVLHFHLLK